MYPNSSPAGGPRQRPARENRAEPAGKNVVGSQKWELNESLSMAGGYYQVPRGFLAAMSRNEANFLSDLMNLSTVNQDHADRDSGFFLCTEEYLERMYWTEDQQKRNLRFLVAEGLVETKRVGNGAGNRTFRKLRVVWNKVRALLAGVSRRGENHPSRGVENHGVITNYSYERNHSAEPLAASPPPASGRGCEDTVSLARATVSSRQRSDAAQIPSNKVTPPVTSSNGKVPPGKVTPPKPSTRRGSVVGLLYDEMPATGGGAAAVTEFHRACAARLRDGLYAANSINGGYKLNSWAKEFRLLLDALGGDGDRLERVLAWYVKNVGREYVPVAMCGRSFRTKFGQIEMAMARDKADEPVEVSPEAVKVVETDLADLSWPKGSEKQLPQVAEQSLRNYKDFLAKLHAYGERVKAEGKRTRLAGFHAYLTDHLDKPRAFVGRWLKQVHDRIRGWDGWNGDLKSWAFRPDHREFRKIGETYAASYSHDAPTLWEDFIKAVGVEA